MLNTSSHQITKLRKHCWKTKNVYVWQYHILERVKTLPEYECVDTATLENCWALSTNLKKPCVYPVMQLFHFQVYIQEKRMNTSAGDTSKGVCYRFFLTPRHSKSGVLNLFGTRDCLHGRQYFHGLGAGDVWGWFGGDSLTSHLLCTLFLLYQLHLRSSSMRSQG